MFLALGGVGFWVFRFSYEGAKDLGSVELLPTTRSVDSGRPVLFAMTAVWSECCYGGL